MDKIALDKYTCIRCGNCVVACPVRLFFRESPDDYPSVDAERAAETCIACHHCVAICPTGSITVGGVGAGMCEPYAKDAVPRFEHIASLARMRRSIRHYAEQPLEDRILEQLLDVVRWAPSAKNGLPVKWIVVNDRAKVVELGALVVDWIRKLDAGDGLAEAWDRGCDLVFRGAPCLVVAYAASTATWPEVDTAIAVETLDLCASAMRLGSCWAGYFIRAAQNDPPINAWLGLDASQTVHGGLMLGYPDSEIYRKIPYRPELDLRWIR